MYLLLSDGHGIGPWVIRLFTRSKWSHVDIVLGPDLNDPKTRIVGATTKGVIDYTLGERLDHAKRAVAMPLEILGSTPEEKAGSKKIALDWLQTQIGRPYDWGAIFFAIGLNRNWQDEDNWFCSELGATFALRLGVPIVDPGVDYRVTPQDLANTPLAKITVK